MSAVPINLGESIESRDAVDLNVRLASLTHSPQWFAAYTCVRHEKCVRRQLDERQIESFLPLYRRTRQWKDRRKEIEFALFPGYVFVRIHEQARLRVLELPGVIRMVSFNGRLAALEEKEIESLRSGLENGVFAEPYPFLRVGRKVRVVRGPVAGLEGVLVRKKDRVRVVVSLLTIMQSIALEVDATDLEPC
jgi:transcription antitermination factor NusG